MNARNLNHLNHYAEDMDEVPFSHACDVKQNKQKIPDNDHKKAKKNTSKCKSQNYILSSKKRSRAFVTNAKCAHLPIVYKFYALTLTLIVKFV